MRAWRSKSKIGWMIAVLVWVSSFFMPYAVFATEDTGGSQTAAEQPAGNRETGNAEEKSESPEAGSQLNAGEEEQPQQSNDRLPEKQPGASSTNPDQRPEGLTLVVTQGAKTITEKYYSFAELEEMPLQRVVFTSIDAEGTPQKIWAEGLPLLDLAALLEVQPEQMKNVRMYSSEGWNRSFTYHFLYGVERYTYPNLVESFRNNEVNKAANGKEAAAPILALRSAEQLMPRSEAWEQMGYTYGLRLCYGQLAPKDVCSTLYGNHITKLVFDTKTETEDSGVGLGAGTQLTGGSDDITDTVERSVKVVRQTAAGSQSYEVPGELKVRIGYLGYGEPILRKAFSFEELRSLSKLKQPYTAIDQQGELLMETAVGFRLVDLVAAAGIDLNAVQSFCFYSDDPAAPGGTSFSRQYLIETPRYYYPNLPNKWDGTPKPGAAVGAIRVPAMLAWKDHWDTGSSVPDYYNINGENRFRLVLGQANAADQTGEDFIRWIHTIDIIIAGTPPTNGAGQIISSKIPVQSNVALPERNSKTRTEIGDEMNVSGEAAPLKEQNVVAPQKKVFELAQTVAIEPTSAKANGPLLAVGGLLLLVSVCGHAWLYRR